MTNYKWKEMECKNGVWRFNHASDFYEVSNSAPLAVPDRWKGGKGRDAYGDSLEMRSSRKQDAMHSKAWSGTDSFKEANDLAVYGWKDGVKLARPIAEKLSEELIETLARPQVVYDVEGEMFDMGKVIDDEPECWMHWQSGEDESNMEESKKGPIKIVLNSTVSAGISQDVIRRKGAAVMALAMVFQAAGRPTKIEVVCPIRDQNIKEVSVVLKDFYDEPQIDCLAYALIHPSFFRRHMFSVWEVMDINDQYGYGIPTDTISDKGDLYIGQSMYGDAQWASEASTEAWIRNQLEMQGLKFVK